DLRSAAKGQGILQKACFTPLPEMAVAQQIAHAQCAAALALALMSPVRRFRDGAQIAAETFKRCGRREIEGGHQALCRGERDSPLRERDRIVVDERKRLLGLRQTELL